MKNVFKITLVLIFMALLPACEYGFTIVGNPPPPEDTIVTGGGMGGGTSGGIETGEKDNIDAPIVKYTLSDRYFEGSFVDDNNVLTLWWIGFDEESQTVQYVSSDPTSTPQTLDYELADGDVKVDGGGIDGVYEKNGELVSLDLYLLNVEDEQATELYPLTYVSSKEEFELVSNPYKACMQSEEKCYKTDVTKAVLGAAFIEAIAGFVQKGETCGQRNYDYCEGNILHEQTCAGEVLVECKCEKNRCVGDFAYLMAGENKDGLEKPISMYQEKLKKLNFDFDIKISPNANSNQAIPVSRKIKKNLPH